MSFKFPPGIAKLFTRLTLTAVNLTCHVETDEFDSDEPYIIVFAANLRNQVFKDRDGNEQYVPASRTTLIGPWDDADTGETKTTIAPPRGLEDGSPFFLVVRWPCWGTDGKPAPIISPDHVIFLAAVVEHDTGEPEGVRAAVQSVLSNNLQGYVNDASMDRAEMVQSLKNDMNGTIKFAGQGFESDDQIGGAKELAFTIAELDEARSNKTSKKLDFNGDGGKYTVKFVLRKA